VTRAAPEVLDLGHLLEQHQVQAPDVGPLQPVPDRVVEIAGHQIDPQWPATRAVVHLGVAAIVDVGDRQARLAKPDGRGAGHRSDRSPQVMRQMRMHEVAFVHELPDARPDAERAGQEGEFGGALAVERDAANPLGDFIDDRTAVLHQRPIRGGQLAHRNDDFTEAWGQPGAQLAQMQGKRRLHGEAVRGHALGARRHQDQVSQATRLRVLRRHGRRRRGAIL
jgi:hypothetical protein